MHQALLELTEGIDQANRSLLVGYDPDQLYALRVGIRRIRSMLKQIGSQRARRFRKTWGGYAAVTNRARDWDVFLATAAGLLPANDFGRFEQASRHHVRGCREAVTDLLGSVHWHHHLREWRAYLLRAHETPNGGGAPAPTLDLALARWREALSTALALGDDRSWHKFRIAVKEVRYQADSIASGGAADPELEELIEDCKVLQALLGDWHDSVVQLQLLEDTDELSAHTGLRSAIGRRREDQLGEIRAAVARKPMPGGEVRP